MSVTLQTVLAQFNNYLIQFFSHSDRLSKNDFNRTGMANLVYGSLGTARRFKASGSAQTFEVVKLFKRLTS